MEKAFLKQLPARAAMLAAVALAGCGTHAAKDFDGAWHALNRFRSAPVEIPLTPPYTFFAAPMDGTLKTMLARWSKDAGMTLSYQLHSDYSLFTPVAQIHTTDIFTATQKLSVIYAMQGVVVAVKNRQIVVHSAATGSPAPAMNVRTKDALKSVTAAGPHW